MTGPAAWNIVFEPSLPLPLILVLGALGIAVLAYSAWRGARGAPWRATALAVTLTALFNPTIQSEDRAPVPDVAVIILDKSQSMGINTRSADADIALRKIEAELEGLPEIETRIVTVEDNAASTSDDTAGTRGFSALERALADVPHERIAGAIFITDGQVHDVPRSAASLGFNAPVHALITGQPDEQDRRLTVLEAPRFGLVDKSVKLSLRVDDGNSNEINSALAPVTISVDGKQIARRDIAIGAPASFSVPLDHGGPNVIEIDVGPGPDELTLANNRAVIVTNGIRDRLRVLLISGEPHPGERTWRNLLRADPSVDLVHFTILRPPEKEDGTPVSELSLIAFPTRELFVDKLDEFDLIIFDRYKRQNVLPLSYLSNVADFVENGGAVLDAAGPSFASPFSLYRTPLAAILPAQPTGEITIGAFRPELTSAGRRHPVTAGLPDAGTLTGDNKYTPPTWGSWFRTINTVNDRGEVIMATPSGNPLLVLDHAGKGRVAQLLSDQFWLWSRGYEGGGPQSELLRRVGHWLMKEPDLEEENLAASISGTTLTLKRRTMGDTVPDITITSPTGKISMAKPELVAPGRFEAHVEAREQGLYRASQGDLTAVAAAGPLNPVEFADVRATTSRLAPVTSATGGGTFWIGKDAADTPDIRAVREGKDAAGSGWLGLQHNDQYVVRAVRRVPLLVGPIALLLILGALALAWRREGR
tara:strand:- start:18975 stop:21092 length:2118 start_codon:yes stop_codon:yes gene_type:complete